MVIYKKIMKNERAGCFKPCPFSIGMIKLYDEFNVS